MILSKETFAQAAKEQTNLLHLPEKVLQFGTGVLLRGFPIISSTILTSPKSSTGE